MIRIMVRIWTYEATDAHKQNYNHEYEYIRTKSANKFACEYKNQEMHIKVNTQNTKNIATNRNVVYDTHIYIERERGRGKCRFGYRRRCTCTYS